MVEIQNNDLLCMPRAIGVSWAKHNQVSTAEWRLLTQEQDHMTTTDKIMYHHKVPTWYYNQLRTKNRKEQKTLALRLCTEAGLPIARMCHLNDISAFENVLNVQILVISAACGNKFIRVGENKPNNIYLYFDDQEEHFHAITKMESTLFKHLENGCSRKDMKTLVIAHHLTVRKDLNINFLCFKFDSSYERVYYN